MNEPTDTDELRKALRRLRRDPSYAGHHDRVQALASFAADELDAARAALSASPVGEREPMPITERQAVLDVVNLYGDETLHSALDAIGWPDDWSRAAGERDTTEADEDARRCGSAFHHDPHDAVVGLSDTPYTCPGWHGAEGATVQAGERDEAYWCLALLVQLKDGPRDDAYHQAKAAAWAKARTLLAARPAPVTGKGEPDEGCRSLADDCEGCWACMPPTLAPDHPETHEYVPTGSYVHAPCEVCGRLIVHHLMAPVPSVPAQCDIMKCGAGGPHHPDCRCSGCGWCR